MPIFFDRIAMISFRRSVAVALIFTVADLMLGWRVAQSVTEVSLTSTLEVAFLFVAGSVLSFVAVLVIVWQDVYRVSLERSGQRLSD